MGPLLLPVQVMEVQTVMDKTSLNATNDTYGHYLEGESQEVQFELAGKMLALERSRFQRDRGFKVIAEAADLTYGRLGAGPLVQAACRIVQ